MPGHGLLPTTPPPSLKVLFRWLEEHNVYRSDALDIIRSRDSGWGVRANRSLGLGEIGTSTRPPSRAPDLSPQS